jgi:HK97 family phage portal protein
MNLLVVFGCVQLISDSIATLPVHVLRDHQHVEPPPWLADNAEVDRIDLFTSVLASLLLDGNAFIAVGRNERTQPVTLDVLDPNRVQLEVGAGGRPDFFIDSVRFPGEMLMIRGMVMPGKIRGLSPIEAARQTIGLGLGGQDAAASFYRQGSVIPGVIHSKSDLSIEAMREIRDQWMSSHAGSSRAHLPLIITGDTSFTPTFMSPEQAQFLQSRQFTDAQIAGQLFMVDPSMLGIPTGGTQLTYQNLEQRGHHLVRHTLLRWIVRLEKGLGRLLPADQQMKFNVTALERADLSTRYASYKTAAEINGLLGMPLLSVSEMRKLEDLGEPEDTGLPTSPQEDQ